MVLKVVSLVLLGLLLVSAEPTFEKADEVITNTAEVLDDITETGAKLVETAFVGVSAFLNGLLTNPNTPSKEQQELEALKEELDKLQCAYEKEKEEAQKKLAEKAQAEQEAQEKLIGARTKARTYKKAVEDAQAALNKAKENEDGLKKVYEEKKKVSEAAGNEVKKCNDDYTKKINDIQHEISELEC